MFKHNCLRYRKGNNAHKLMHTLVYCLGRALITTYRVIWITCNMSLAYWKTHTNFFFNRERFDNLNCFAFGPPKKSNKSIFVKSMVISLFYSYVKNITLHWECWKKYILVKNILLIYLFFLIFVHDEIFLSSKFSKKISGLKYFLQIWIFFTILNVG